MKQSLKNPPAAGQAKKAILDPLISLGLTEREAEVLTWIAQGKGNYEIGVILGARTRTICKHVERILTKLKVENRTAAAAIALQRHQERNRYRPLKRRKAIVSG